MEKRKCRLAVGRSLVLPLHLVIGLIFIILPAVSASAQGSAPAPLVLIVDASGSMWGQVDGDNKIVIARRVLGQLVDDLPAAGQVALVAYGHRRKGDCQDIETLIPLGALDREAVKSAVADLNPKGKTPLTASVEQALELIKERGEAATVVLLSDGLETCAGDPCRAVRLAKESGTPLVMHVVGFDVGGEDLSQLQCMAQAGDGMFLTADNAGELGEALEAAIAMPVDAPVGRLVVHAVANGELQDVAIHVKDANGKEAATARTYRRQETNPSYIPLADGSYDVRILAVGFKGAREQHFKIEILDGNVVEKKVDFSTGELSLGVLRNGTLSDAVYKVYSTGDGKEVASGRTYKGAKTNPAQVRLTAGTYQVKVQPLEVSNKRWIELGQVEIEPRGRQTLEHAFESSSLSIGTVRGEQRVDALVYVAEADGKSVAQGRTYKGPPSNPKGFELLPGKYLIRVRTVGKNRQEQKAEVLLEAGAQMQREFDFNTPEINGGEDVE